MQTFPTRESEGGVLDAGDNISIFNIDILRHLDGIFDPIIVSISITNYATGVQGIKPIVVERFFTCFLRKN